MKVHPLYDGRKLARAWGRFLRAEAEREHAWRRERIPWRRCERVRERFWVFVERKVS